MPVPRATQSISETAPTARPSQPRMDFVDTSCRSSPHPGSLLLTHYGLLPTPTSASSQGAGASGKPRDRGGGPGSRAHAHTSRPTPCAGGRRLAPPTGPCPAHWPLAFCEFWRKRARKGQGLGLVLRSCSCSCSRPGSAAALARIGLPGPRSRTQGSTIEV